MGVFRIFPSKDTWITTERPDNSFSTTLRSSGSNHGRSPALNVFARKGEIVSGSVELARAMVQFDITELSGLLFEEQVIPSSSVTYHLRVFDQKHDNTVPTSYDMFVFPMSRSWDEGLGIDDDNHTDLGFASWTNATSLIEWDVTGSDFITGSVSASQHFDIGTEDLDVDVSSIINEWLTGSTISNNGVVLKLGDVEETGSTNFYRKSFHSKESLFIDQLPYVEARWEDTLKDNRSNFVFDISGSLVFYNFVRGELQTLTGPVTASIKDNIAAVSATFDISVTAVEVIQGVFTASFIIGSGSHSGTFNDVWSDGSSLLTTGSFVPTLLTGSLFDVNEQYVIAPRGLKGVYRENEKARIGLNVRKRDFVTHRGVLSTSSLTPETEFIEKMYYSVINDTTGEVVIPFGTGSVPYTQLSYNATGNYFDLWMSTFVPGFKYEIIFLLDINNDEQIVSDNFTFRVK